ncbi:phosphoglucosamine mutase [Magnetococcales bacterium HHB-1]
MVTEAKKSTTDQTATIKTSKRRMFGTDGIRGPSNAHPMTAEMVLKIGRAAGKVFQNHNDRRHTVLIGKDTRLSGYMFESALQAGFTSMGINCLLVGVMPTPAVAFLTRAFRADAGVMISASHNPFQDNGIKFFGPDGMKLPDSKELAIEEALLDLDMNQFQPEPRGIGRAFRIDDSDGRYIEFCKNSFPKQLRLDGLRVVLDCANGAAYKVAPRVFWELGAEVIAIGDQPNGININDGYGALHAKRLQNKVKEVRADIGIALDGDADRLIVCDEQGKILDGDYILAMCGLSLHKKGELQGNGLVATVMSNLGLERMLKSHGLKLERTQVGDRFVLKSMLEKGFNVGGEQSGHLIFLDHNSTGDGLIAALQVLAHRVEEDKPLSQLASLFESVPQIHRNVTFHPGSSPLEKESVQQAIEEANKALGDMGRVLVRASGTEPKIRVMVEGDDAQKIQKIADQLVATIQK